MSRISVQQRSAGDYEVSVDGPVVTRHRVTVSDDVRRRIGGDDCSAERLLLAGFEFLLEREPNSSILRTFDFEDIGRYFPEYEEEIRKLLDAKGR